VACFGARADNLDDGSRCISDLVLARAHVDPRQIAVVENAAAERVPLTSSIVITNGNPNPRNIDAAYTPCCPPNRVSSKRLIESPKEALTPRTLQSNSDVLVRRTTPGLSNDRIPELRGAKCRVSGTSIDLRSRLPAVSARCCRQHLQASTTRTVLRSTQQWPGVGPSE
jgi:hypothetical protein